MNKINTIIPIILFGLIASLAVGLPVFAEKQGNGSIQGYAADRPIDFGTIVRLAEAGSNRVTEASQKDQQNMLGVVVDPQLVPVRISDGDLDNETFVAVSGTYSVLVSTQGGEISPGDYVALSSVSGVAMKASTEEKTVFGRASGLFDDKSLALGTIALKDTDGQASKDVRLGSIPVTIDIRRNPNEKSTKANLPEVLQRAGLAIAEKEVSPIRIYLSMAIAAVSLLAAVIVIYSGVRHSVVSIGRNPMSKKSIFRALLEIILTSIAILIIGLFAVYLLLRL